MIFNNSIPAVWRLFATAKYGGWSLLENFITPGATLKLRPRRDVDDENTRIPTFVVSKTSVAIKYLKWLNGVLYLRNKYEVQSYLLKKWLANLESESG